MIVCGKMRRWTHKTLSLRILFLQQTGNTALHNRFVITCLYQTEGCFPKVALAASCCVSPSSARQITPGGWQVLDHLPRGFPTAACPWCPVGWGARWTKHQPLCPMVAWRSSCMHCSIFVLPCCCLVVFQAVLCSRCSQSHMCFFAPSNDIFPMKTVPSTAFAVFVKKTNPTLWFSFQPFQK